MMGIIFLLYFLLVPPTMHAQKQTSQRLTMKDAIQRALKHNPDLKAWRYEVQALKSNAKSEMAGYYPTIDLSSKVYQNNGETNLDSSTQLSKPTHLLICRTTPKISASKKCYSD